MQFLTTLDNSALSCYNDKKIGGVVLENDRWLSLKEICDYLGVSRDTVLNWIKVKGMPSCKMGKFWKFKKDDVDIWVKSGESAIEKKEEFTK